MLFRNRAEQIYKYQHLFWGAAALVIILCTLFAGGEIGLSDNGDFGRVLQNASLAPAPADSSFWFVKTYAIRLQDGGLLRNTARILFDTSALGSYPSVQILFVRLSVALNLLYNYAAGCELSRYRIGVLGIMYSICYAWALSFLCAQIRLSKRWMDALGKGLLILIFCDVGYTAYFNSFYGEALQLVAFVFVAAFAAKVLRGPRVTPGDALGSAAACAVFGWSKFSNIPAAIFLCLGIEFAAWRRSRKCCPVLCAGLSCAILLAAVAVIPSWMNYDTTYNSIFYGILKDTDEDTSAAYLRELSLDPALAALADTNAYASGVSQAVESGDYHDPIASVSKADLARFYLLHPALLAGAVGLSIRHSGLIRPYYLSNYDVSRPRFTLSGRFSLWSAARAACGFDSLAGNLLVLAAFFIVLYQLLKGKPSGFLVPAAAIACAAGYSLCFPYIANGNGDLAKHMFAFVQLEDAFFISVLLFGLNALTGDRKARRGFLLPVLVCAVLVSPAAASAVGSRLQAARTHTAVEAGSYVAFGSYGGEALTWRVVSADGGTVCLLCERPVCDAPFAASGENYWPDSSLREWLRTDFLDGFSEAERSLLAPVRHAVLVSSAFRDCATFGDRDFYCEHIAALSIMDYDRAYGLFSTDAVALPSIAQISAMALAGETVASDSAYWLETPYYNNGNMVRCVFPDGYVVFRDASEQAGVRPVIYVAVRGALSGSGSRDNPFRLTSG